MNKLCKIKKLLTFIVCGVLTLNLTFAYSEKQEKTAQAKTIAELQQERAENEKKIESLKEELAQYNQDMVEEKSYQDTLTQQIILMQDNIAIVDEELNRIKSDISTAEDNINQLVKDIAQQEVDITNNTEIFKERLRAMYVTGNDSLASAVIGATDFYDMLSRVEMVNRIAKHDSELIETLKTQLETLDAEKSALESEKLTLEEKKTEQENKRSEFESLKSEYNSAFEQSEEYLSSLKLKADINQKDIDTLEAENIANQEEEDKLSAEIKRKQEEAKKAKEEAEKQLTATTSTTKSTTKTTTKTTTKSATQTTNKSTTQNTTSSTSKSTTTTAKSTQAVTTQPTTQTTTKTTTTTTTTTTLKPTTTTTTTTTTAKPTTTTTTTTTYEEPVDTTPSYSSSSFIWPAPGGYYISSGFGSRWGTTHRGIDIAGGSIRGTSAVASRAGTVIMVNNSCTHDYAKNSSCGCGGGYGNYVVIDHGDSYSTLYGHMTSVYVSVGDYVEQGQAVGSVGCTGYSTGNHLHFEIRIDGTAVDPESYLN